MSFELRPYQIPIVEAALAAIRRGDKEVLIAACPAAGKTEMAFEIVRRLVAEGAIDKALMLAWLRNDLKTQTLLRLEARAPGLTKHLHIDIPQQRHRIKGAFDLLIQDEAHQGYDVEGGMVESVKVLTKVKTTLLLTGSPSTFIKRGLKPCAVFALEDLHAAGRASDLTIEVGTSAYNILDKDFNQAGDVTDVAAGRGTQEQTDETFDKLLDGLFKRLKLGRHSMNWWNRTILKTAKKGWNPILRALKKTIIACRDIKQAEQVAHYFRSQKVDTLVSHSKLDADGENIEAFGRYDTPLLVVVDRAQLGYDNPDLVNFIDMTGSKNPDRIFQMLCRVVRPGNVEKKLFVKVMPASFADQNLLLFMEGVLNLSRREIFETYDGTGFYKQEVPARARKPRDRGEGRDKAEVTDGISEPVLEPGMSLFGPLGYFTAITHTNHDGYEPIGQVRLGDVVGVRVQDSESTKRAIIDFFKSHGRWPSFGSKGTEENKLAHGLGSYKCPASSSYDPEFVKQITDLGWMPRTSRVDAKKDEIISFFQKHSKWPSQGAEDDGERRLARSLNSYKSPASGSYDPEFSWRIEQLSGMSATAKVVAEKEKIISFFQKYSRWPSPGAATDTIERKLGYLLSGYISQTSKCYDPEFVNRIEQLGRQRKDGKKAA